MWWRWIQIHSFVSCPQSLQSPLCSLPCCHMLCLHKQPVFDSSINTKFPTIWSYYVSKTVLHISIYKQIFYNWWTTCLSEPYLPPVQLFFPARIVQPSRVIKFIRYSNLIKTRYKLNVPHNTYTVTVVHAHLHKSKITMVLTWRSVIQH